MPQAIPLAAALFVTVVETSKWAAFWIMTGASVVAGLLQQSLVREPRDPGMKLNTRTIQDEIPVIYGQDLVGGNDVEISTVGSANHWLWIIQTVSEGKISGIASIGGEDQVFLDENLQSGYGTVYGEELVTYWLFQGDATHDYTSDAGLNDFYTDKVSSFTAWATSTGYEVGDSVENDSDGYVCILAHTSSATDEPGTGANWKTYWAIAGDNYRHTAFIVWKLRYHSDKFRGIPRRTMLINGKLLYDFRDSSTTWSDNPVLALYDYMTNEVYGLGYSSSQLDAAASSTWTDAANYCDTKGWTINTTFRQRNSWDVINAICRLFRGQLIWYDGKFYLRYADLNDESSSMTLTDTHLLMDDSGRAAVRVGQPSRFNRPTAMRGTFVNPQKNYTLDHVVIGEALGNVENIELVGASAGDDGAGDDAAHVANLTNYYLERRQLDRVVSGTFRDDAIQLEPHDIVTFTASALGVSSQTMRVTESQILEDGLIALSLQYENLALYNDNYDTDVESVYACTIPSPFSFPAPTGITIATSVINTVTNFPIIDVKITWDSSTYGFIDYWVVQYKKSTESDWITLPNVHGDSDEEVHVYGLDNATWNFRVKAVSITGVSSDWNTSTPEVISESQPLGKTFYQANEPSGEGEVAGDWWVDSDNGQVWHYDGTNWIPTTSNIPTNDGLLGFWDFNEGEGTTAYDKTAYNNHGTITGAGTHWITGVSATGFQGISSVSACSFGNLSPIDDLGHVTNQPDFTVTFWTKLNLSGPSDLIYKDEDANNRIAIWCDSTSDTIFVTVIKSGTLAFEEFEDSLINDNAWHHVVVVFDLTGTGLVSIWVDGNKSTYTLDISTNFSVSGYDNAADLKIPGVTGTGYFDEVRLYDRVLAPPEILSLYRDPSGGASTVPWQITTGNLPSDEDLLGYWDFEEGSGTKAYDKSGNANNGTLEGTAPAWATGISGKCFSNPGTNERVDITFISDISEIAPLDDLGESTGTPDFTLSFWMKSDGSVSSGRLFSLGSASDSPTSTFIVRQATNQGYLQVYASDLTTGAANTRNFQDITPYDSNWHHITVTVDTTNGQVGMHIDGVLSAYNGSRAITAFNPNTYGVSWGANYAGNTAFDGELDECRIYSGILTPQEIKALYYYPSGNQSISYGGSRLDGPYLTVGPSTERGEYASISDALDDISALGGSGIFLKPGTWSIDNETLPAQDIHFLGQSQEDTVVSGPASANDCFIAGGAYQYMFSNLTMTSNHTAAAAMIYVGAYAADIMCKNVTYNGDATYGNFIEGASSTGTYNIESCIINDGTAAIDIDGASFVKVVNGYFYSNSTRAIELANVENLLVNNNYFEDCLIGVYCGANCDYVTINSNQIYYSGSGSSFGLFGSSTVSTTITGNIIELTSTNSTCYAISANTDGATTITGNYIKLNSNSIGLGIYSGPDYAQIAGNTIVVDGGTGSTNYGVYLTGSYGAVTGNSIDMVSAAGTSYGIYSNSGDYNTVAGNTIQNYDTAISLAGSNNDTTGGNVT